MDKISTLSDFVTDYVDSNFSVRPETLDSIEPKIRLAVVELQKENVFPETTISFDSLDMKEEKRDANGELIYNFYELPEDFRQLYNKGPALEVEESSRHYTFIDYSRFITLYSSSSEPFMTVHRFNGEYGKRHRLILTPFPKDSWTVHVTYYSNGVDMPIDAITEEYYMPVINHVLAQLGLKNQREWKDGVNDIKRNQQDLSGQGSHHDSFTRTRPRFFGNHRR